MITLPNAIERDDFENDFKPLEIPPGWESFAGFFEAYNAQAKRLIGHKVLLLDTLKPWHHGRENAWQAIVTTAMGYRNVARRASRGGPNDLYRKARGLRDHLLKEADKLPLGEYGDYRINELILLLDGIIAARPKQRHGLTKAPVPAEMIYRLAYLYQRSTGSKPGAGKGPFAIFVTVFWDALGNERKEDALKNDLQQARKARPEAFEVETQA